MVPCGENLPNIISVDPGDKDLPLVVIDEQSSNHDGCFSVPTCHRETKCRLRKMQQGVARGNQRKGEEKKKRGRRRSESSEWESDYQHRETLVPYIRFPSLSHAHTLQLAQWSDSFNARICLNRDKSNSVHMKVDTTSKTSTNGGSFDEEVASKSRTPSLRQYVRVTSHKSLPLYWGSFVPPAWSR